MTATNIIFVPLPSAALYQVNFSSQDIFQFSLHIDLVDKRPMDVFLKGHQEIHVTIWPEVLPQNRSEQGQFLDLPPQQKSSICFNGK